MNGMTAGGSSGINLLDSPYAADDNSFTCNMDQLYEQVCMMSGGAVAETSNRDEGLIKQEDGFRGLPDFSARIGGTSGNPCSSPSATILYSPTSTGGMGSDFDYGDCADEVGSSPRLQTKRGYRDIPSSPSSPDNQFCSSTTSTDQLQPTPESIKEEDTPKRSCLVCGDTASGFHYGVASCEACKAFFKRTIQGNIEYNCPATNDCEINKRRRKACQACRFHKCLRVGMLKEGVRLDRVRGGRQKYRRTSESPFAMSPLPKRTSLDDIKLLSDLQLCEPELLTLRDLKDSCINPEHQTLSTIAQIYDRELVQIIGWAKQIPGFTTLALNDQMRLLQSTWGEILTLSLAYRSSPSMNRKLNYAGDFTIDELTAKDFNAGELFTQIMGVVERLEQCNIHKEEFLLLKALVLTNSDVRIQDADALYRLRQNILQAIHDAVGSLRSRDSTSYMQSLLLCLPSLRAADTCLRKFWLSIRQNGNIDMNKLFLEMLETQFR